MSRAGRKPTGPALVERLEGSERAKERLETILETISGRLTIEQACRRLGIHATRFHALRDEALEASLERLEPKAAGRPPHVETEEMRRCAELEDQVDRLQVELQLAETRGQIVQILSSAAEVESSDESSGKKTTDRRRKSRRKRPSRRSRARPR